MTCRGALRSWARPAGRIRRPRQIAERKIRRRTRSRTLLRSNATSNGLRWAEGRGAVAWGVERREWWCRWSRRWSCRRRPLWLSPVRFNPHSRLRLQCPHVSKTVGPPPGRPVGQPSNRPVGSSDQQARRRQARGPTSWPTRRTAVQFGESACEPTYGRTRGRTAFRQARGTAFREAGEVREALSSS